jgi:hypothetical protein
LNIRVLSKIDNERLSYRQATRLIKLFSIGSFLLVIPSIGQYIYLIAHKEDTGLFYFQANDQSINYASPLPFAVIYNYNWMSIDLLAVIVLVSLIFILLVKTMKTEIIANKDLAKP